jgi:hypothetical protein
MGALSMDGLPRALGKAPPTRESSNREPLQASRVIR